MQKLNALGSSREASRTISTISCPSSKAYARRPPAVGEGTLSGAAPENLKATQRGGADAPAPFLRAPEGGGEEKINLVEALHQQYTLLRPLLGESIQLS